jgi:Protein of unknown function (DUF4058)
MRRIMPLLDHFETPLDPRRAWESFYSRWANSIADQLNETLPRRFFAQVQIHLGTQVEAEVAEFELRSGPDEAANENGAGGVAVQPWAPPVAVMTMPVVFPDVFRVIVRDELDGARLVAVVELVSPSNKDRPDSRLVFAGKTAAFLQSGVGLILIDVVTDRHFNLHDELVGVLGLDSSFSMDADAHLYAVAYLPNRRAETNQIDAWTVVLSVGSTLPVLPLALRGSNTVPLDLNAAYDDACRRSRI